MEAEGEVGPKQGSMGRSSSGTDCRHPAVPPCPDSWSKACHGSAEQAIIEAQMPQGWPGSLFIVPSQHSSPSVLLLTGESTGHALQGSQAK